MGLRTERGSSLSLEGEGQGEGEAAGIWNILRIEGHQTLTPTLSQRERECISESGVTSDRGQRAPRGRSLTVLTLLAGAALLIASCTQGLQLADGERGAREVKTVAFLFTDGVAEVTVTPAAPAVTAAGAATAPAPQAPAADATRRAHRAASPRRSLPWRPRRRRLERRRPPSPRRRRKVPLVRNRRRRCRRSTRLS